MADGVDIDLYPEELDHDLEGEYEAEENEDLEDDNVGEDLYDDVIDVSKLTEDGKNTTDISQINDDDDVQADRNEQEESPESAVRVTQDIRVETSSPAIIPSGKKVALYCGNLTWWTSDADLEEAIHGFGVADMMGIKFSENRANGQSKGYCIVEVGSAGSAQKIMENLTKTEIHGNRPVVNYHKGGGLQQYESTGRKNQTSHSSSSNAGNNPRNKQNNQNSSQQSNMNRNMPRGNPRSNPVTNQHRFPMQPNNMRPPTMAPRHTQPNPINLPPPAPAPVRNVMPPMPINNNPMGGNMQRMPNVRGPPPDWQQPQQTQQQPQPHMMQNMHHPHSMQVPNQQHQQNNFMPVSSNVMTPGMHVNPAFLPAQDNFMPKQVPIPQPSQRMETPHTLPNFNRQNNDAVYNEVLQRNQETAQKAITSALADSNAGDRNDAIETLVTARSLIKSSVAANDERSKALLEMIQSCLKNIEAKQSDSSSNRKHRRERDSDRDREHRERSPDRDFNDVDRYDDRRSRHRHHRDGKHEREHRSDKERIRSSRGDKRR